MNKAVEKYIKVATVLTLFIVGGFSFIILAGDENPNNPLPLGEWLFIKAIALIAFATCVLTAKYLNKIGFINIPTEEEE